ncbi:MAG: serine dehydratase subunit alpha family protein [Sporomusa sp.]
MNSFIALLKQEMIPAFGCTEPIALAFTSAKATEVLGTFPDRIEVKCSGNMIKNAKSVIIPNSNGKKGIEYSAILGAIVRGSDKQLEVLEAVTNDDVTLAERLYHDKFCQVSLVPGVETLYITVEAFAGQDMSSVTVKDHHTNIIEVKRNQAVLFSKTKEETKQNCIVMKFDDIYDFAMNENIDEVHDILEKEIEYNMAIAEQGLKKPYGANIGKLILDSEGNSFAKELQAYAAAGSDARMSGCALPVVINSGSGNQGITVSVPIILTATKMAASKTELFRALVFANLIGLYLKAGIGKLSAYCGVVSAASASAAGIAFLCKENKHVIAETLSNSLACLSGMICDGAKASCAMKIAASVGTALLAYEQAKSGNSFQARDGIVKESIDQTIETVGTIGRDGMKETDIVILQKMLEN